MSKLIKKASPAEALLSGLQKKAAFYDSAESVGMMKGLANRKPKSLLRKGIQTAAVGARSAIRSVSRMHPLGRAALGVAATGTFLAGRKSKTNAS